MKKILFIILLSALKAESQNIIGHPVYFPNITAITSGVDSIGVFDAQKKFRKISKANFITDLSLSGGSAAGNYNNIQLNRNGLFDTPASDSLTYTDTDGLKIKNGLNIGYDKFIISADGKIHKYDGIDPGDGQLLVGNGSSGIFKNGSLTTSDSRITIGYSSPNITLALSPMVDTIYNNSGGDSIVFTIKGTRYAIAKGGGGGHVIQNDGTPFTARAALNFLSPAIVVTDNSGSNSSDVSINNFTNESAGFVPNPGGTTGRVLTDTGWAYDSVNLNIVAPLVKIGVDTIGITQATTSTDGYLSSTDWNTFNNKQAALVSGTNIKTVNGSSLLGSGDLTISGGGMAIAGAITSGTQGSVLYAGTGGILQQSNSNFYWDSTHNILGIDTIPIAGNEELSVKGQGLFTDTLRVNTHGRNLDAGSVGVLQLGDSYISKSYGDVWKWNGSVQFASSITVGSSILDPGARLTIAAGTASANTAPLKFTSGTNLTAAEAGAVEFDGTDLFYTTSTPTRRTVANLAGTQTFTNKTLTAPVISSITNTGTLTLPTVTGTIVQYAESSTASNATWSPTGDARENFYDVTAQAAAATTISNPSGSPVNHNVLTIRVKDNGTARALTWSGTQWRASSDLALPSTTTLGKTMYLKFIYNSTDTKWDLIAVLDNF